MSSSATSATFFISGINHCEVRPGQQLTIDHLRALQQQLAEQARARALQQQLQQQSQQQGIRLAGAVSVKAEPGVKKEEDGPQPQAQQPQQLQYAALLALQLQQQQQARAAAAAAAQQQATQGQAGQQPRGGPSALAHNVFPQQGGRMVDTAQAGGAGGRSGGAHGGGRQAKQSKAAAEEEPATDQWVQCSKCQTWRQVPDEFWPDIENADEDEDWLCKDALWDVEDYEPHTAACC